MHDPECENCCNLVSHIFDKNFVKITFLLNKLLNTWFDEIFFSVKVNFSFFHTVRLRTFCIEFSISWHHWLERVNNWIKPFSQGLNGSMLSHNQFQSWFHAWLPHYALPPLPKKRIRIPWISLRIFNDFFASFLVFFLPLS